MTWMACDSELLRDRWTISDDGGSDMLDDFSTVKIGPKASQVSDAGPGRPSTSAQAPEASAKADDDVTSDDEFAKQLQAGMAELMGEMGNSVLQSMSPF